MRLFETLALVVALLAAPTSLRAEGMQVEPGLWEFTSSMPDPLGGDPVKQSYSTCVRDRTITPARVTAKMKECRIWNAVFAGPSVRWKMSCDTPAGPMNGSGSLRSSGSAVSGSLDVTMAIGALEIPMTGSFRGRRVGPCR